MKLLAVKGRTNGQKTTDKTRGHEKGDKTKSGRRILLPRRQNIKKGKDTNYNTAKKNPNGKRKNKRSEATPKKIK
jgi:hypothetical protein